MLVCFEVLGSWRQVSPARQSRSEFRMATQEQRQAMLQRQNCVFACVDVRGLQSFDDISKVGLLLFLELWLGTYP